MELSQAQLLSQLQATVEPLKRENARLTQENRKLHAELIASTERHKDDLEKQRVAIKKLDAENATLRLLNTQHSDQSRRLEQENQQMRLRLQSLTGADGAILNPSSQPAQPRVSDSQIPRPESSILAPKPDPFAPQVLTSNLEVQRHIEQMQYKIDLLTRELSQHRPDVQSLKAQAAAAVHKQRLIEQQSEEISQLKEVIVQLGDTHDALQEKLKVANQERMRRDAEALQARLEEDHDLEDAKRSIADLRQKFDGERLRWQEDITVLQIDLQRARDELAMTNDEVNVLRQSVAEQVAARDRLQDHLEQERKTGDALRRQIQRDADASAAQGVEQASQKQRIIEQQASEIQELKSTITHVSNMRDTLQEKLHVATQERMRRDAEAAQSRHEGSRDIDEAKRAVSDLRIKFESERVKWQSEADAIQLDLQRAREDASFEKAEVARLRLALNEQSANSDRLEGLLDQARHESDALRKQMKRDSDMVAADIASVRLQLKAESSEKATLKQLLANARDEATSELARLQAAVEDIDTARDELQRELDRKDEQIDTMRAKVAESSQLLGSSGVRTDQLQRAYETVQQHLASRDREVASLKNQVRDLQEGTARLQAEVKLRQEELVAVTADLTNMARENQEVNRELAEAQDLQRIAAVETERMRERVMAAEARATLTAQEKSDVLESFRSQSGEAARMQHAVANLEAERSDLRYVHSGCQLNVFVVFSYPAL
eukprot:TRINITY_DN6558_c0_g1_i1.p1 TRINITY_DN6558_c0_g1~~TRINITY_DN6558_c0_g1_i1.p1  ORF type:complete len:733 (-),score=228.00 TRINITY_DN6558_c0_g1_i1:1404-3575(-)